MIVVVMVWIEDPAVATIVIPRTGQVILYSELLEFPPKLVNHVVVQAVLLSTAPDDDVAVIELNGGASAV